MVVLKEQKCQTCNSSRSSYLPLRQAREYMVEETLSVVRLLHQAEHLSKKIHWQIITQAFNREGWVGGCCRRVRGRRRQILPVAQLPDPPLLSRNWLN